jgi:hypothetical protein
MPGAMRPFAIEIMYCAIGRVFGGFLEHNRSGYLHKTAPEIIEYWAGWRGVSGAFYEAFRDIWCEAVEGGHRVRGWHKRYSSLLPPESQTPPTKRVKPPVPKAHDEEPYPSDVVFGAISDENDTENGTDNGCQRLEVRKELPVNASCEAFTGTVTRSSLPAHDPETPTPQLESPPASAGKPRAPKKALSGSPKDPNSAHPHFPHEDRAFIAERLIASKSAPLVGGEYQRLIKAFGERWYRLPEAERPPERPSNAEIRHAVEQVLAATGMADNGAFLRAPETLAECIGRVVEECRIPRYDPEQRIENVCQAAGLRRRRQPSPVAPSGR